MPTLKKRAIAYARRYPGNSATEIANALKANPSTISAVLYRAWRSGFLARVDRMGPSGGYVYGSLEDLNRYVDRWRESTLERAPGKVERPDRVAVLEGKVQLGDL